MLTSNNLLDDNILSKIISEITYIYGPDTNGEGFLKGEELDAINNNLHWFGRTWDTNIQHQIYDFNSNSEEYLYGVHLEFDDALENKELLLSIIGYKSLINYINNK